MEIRYWFVLWLMLVALPGCAKSSPEAAASDDDFPPQRFHDLPPVVSDTVRYQLPVDTRIALAGNYGELRPNHFHGGLDFKTDQTVGHPVYSFADGFVRRAAINAYGYGLVLYVEHPAMGLTSVYGHLDTFGDKVWQRVRERQVSEQLNNADLTFRPGEIPVSRGEVIALSGNTGSSGGPHVHFELRNIPDDDDDVCYDPQMFFLRELKDTKAPRISHVYLYPQPGEGVANGETTRQVTPVTGICATTGGQGGALSKALTAWGRVGLGLKAYDYMDGQTNKYGVKHLRLLLEVPAREGEEKRYQLIYHFRQDAFRFSETRFTNSVTDYAAWTGQKSMIMKSFIEPGNRLQQVDPACGDGIVTIDEERLYHFIYELEDAHGNLTTLSFDVRGVRQPVPARPAPKAGCIRVAQGMPLQLDTAGCHFTAGGDVFYTDVDLPFSVADKATVTRTVSRRVKNKQGKMVTVKSDVQEPVSCVSRVYTLGSDAIPMHTWCALSIDVPDDVEQPQQLYLTNVDAGGTVRHSQYVAPQPSQQACLTGSVREAGRYAVRRDSRGPELSVVQSGWQKMEIAVTDADSGVRRFCVLIDGKFVPFNMDNKARYYGEPCHYGIAKGGDHKVEIRAWDNCDNESYKSFILRF